jgi:hypothetical protein
MKDFSQLPLDADLTESFFRSYEGASMSSETKTTVRMFGALHTIRKDRGEDSTVEVTIPAGGCTASVLAEELNLPLDQVEAVFVNHQIYSLRHTIEPGDRVAFVPKGIPGPARGLLGIYRAGNNDSHSPQ